MKANERIFENLTEQRKRTMSKIGEYSSLV